MEIDKFNDFLDELSFQKTKELNFFIAKNMNEKNTVCVLSFLLLYAVENRKQDWIDTLIEDPEFELEMVIDRVNNKTLLSSIIQYPFYSDLFKKLVDMGAKTYVDQLENSPEFPNFRRNVLMLSTQYNEFENLEYLLEKGIVGYKDILNMCADRKKPVLMTHFVEHMINPNKSALGKKEDSKEAVSKGMDLIQEFISEKINH